MILKKQKLQDQDKKSMKNESAPRVANSEVDGRLAKMIDELTEWGYLIGKTEIKLNKIFFG